MLSLGDWLAATSLRSAGTVTSSTGHEHGERSSMMKLSSEGMSRRGFLRRAGLAGAGGMALAAFGEGIGVKAAGAAVVPKTKRKETVLWQASATACPGCILTCTTAEGHCGSPMDRCVHRPVDRCARPGRRRPRRPAPHHRRTQRRRAEPPGRPGPPPGAPLPLLEGTDIDGQPTDTSDLVGDSFVLLALSPWWRALQSSRRRSRC